MNTKLVLSTLPTSLGFKAARKEQILAGYRRLSDRQRPGQVFSYEEIATECGVTRRAVMFDCRNALHKFATRLHASSPGIFEEMLGGKRTTQDLFAGLLRADDRTGRPTGRNSNAGTAKSRRVHEKVVSEFTLNEFVGLVRSRRPRGCPEVRD